jgi:hypothetical protein
MPIRRLELTYLTFNMSFLSTCLSANVVVKGKNTLLFRFAVPPSDMTEKIMFFKLIWYIKGFG